MCYSQCCFHLRYLYCHLPIMSIYCIIEKPFGFFDVMIEAIHGVLLNGR